MYPQGQTTNIGTLLRMIREDQSKSVPATPPASQSGSAIRELVQEPLSSPEDPGSSRVVSLRPEGVTQSGPDGVQPATPDAPVSSTTPKVVGPVAPPPPSPAAPATSSPAPSAPSQPSSQLNKAAPQPIATQIKSSPQAVLGIRSFTPQRSTVGSKIVQKKPTLGTRFLA